MNTQITATSRQATAGEIVKHFTIRFDVCPTNHYFELEL